MPEHVFGCVNLMVQFSAFTLISYCNIQSHFPPPGGGEEHSHMKQTGMLVVLLRGLNFGVWSRLGCSGQGANILYHQGLF